MRMMSESGASVQDKTVQNPVPSPVELQTSKEKERKQTVDNDELTSVQQNYMIQTTGM